MPRETSRIVPLYILGNSLAFLRFQADPPRHRRRREHENRRAHRFGPMRNTRTAEMAVWHLERRRDTGEPYGVGWSAWVSYTWRMTRDMILRGWATPTNGFVFQFVAVVCLLSRRNFSWGHFMQLYRTMYETANLSVNNFLRLSVCLSVRNPYIGQRKSSHLDRNYRHLLRVKRSRCTDYTASKQYLSTNGHRSNVSIFVKSWSTEEGTNVDIPPLFGHAYQKVKNIDQMLPVAKHYRSIVL